MVFKNSTEIHLKVSYDKQDDFNFEIVNVPFFDGDVPRSPFYVIYIAQLIRFARVCSNVEDFKNRKKLTSNAVLLFVDHVCYFCQVFVILSRLFIAALWSPAGKRLTSGLLFVSFNCVFVTFPCGILGQVWYLIVSIPDLFRLSYFF